MGLGVCFEAVQGGLVLEHRIPQDLQLLVAGLLPTAARQESLPHQGQRRKRPASKRDFPQRFANKVSCGRVFRDNHSIHLNGLAWMAILPFIKNF